MLLTIAFMRITAWLFHDAALAIPMIVVELVMSTVLFFGAKRMSKNLSQKES